VGFYIPAGVFKLKKTLDDHFPDRTAVRRTEDGLSIVEYRSGRRIVRLKFKRISIPCADGSELPYWLGWVHLPDNPPLVLQNEIECLLKRSRCHWHLHLLEWGVDVFPKSDSATGSTVRPDNHGLVPPAAVAKSEGMRPALCEIQDALERTLHLKYGGTAGSSAFYKTSYRGTRERKSRLKIYYGPKH